MLPERKKRVQEAIKRLLPEDGIVAVDVGARGDIPSHWLPMDGLATIVSFDPDVEACTRLRETYAARGNAHMYRVYPIALSAETEERTLYVTNSGGGSSLFDVDVPIVRAYTDEEYLFPLQKTTIQTRSARDVFREIDCTEFHLMKLDIQGAELEVLTSLGEELMRPVLAVELEAALQVKGVGYPTFVDVDTFMRRQGFDLYDVNPVRVHRSLRGRRSNYLEDMLGVDVRSPSVAGRAWEVDALYIRSPESLVSRIDVGTILRVAVCFGLYDLFTEALHSLSVASDVGLLDRHQFAEMTSAIVQWHRSSSYRWWHSTNWGGRIARRIAKRVRRTVDPIHGALSS